jgi:hypothetical protein
LTGVGVGVILLHPTHTHPLPSLKRSGICFLRRYDLVRQELAGSIRELAASRKATRISDEFPQNLTVAQCILALKESLASHGA